MSRLQRRVQNGGLGVGGVVTELCGGVGVEGVCLHAIIPRKKRISKCIWPILSLSLSLKFFVLLLCVES